MRRSTASSSWDGSACLALGLLAVGCGGGGGGSNASHACLPALSRDCTPLYDPTFDMIFKNRIGPTCGAVTTGGSCHAEQGARGGLVMQTANEAYDHLLGHADGRKRVIAGDPECSLMLERIAATNPVFRMPPGASPLAADEQCAIELWIAEGAKR